MTQKFSPIYNIKKASQKTGITSNLIRAYERLGLIRPFRKDDNNYRLFTEDEVEWIARIKKLINEVGFNVEGIKSILTIEPCWEHRNCPEDLRNNCPAYQNYNTPCWQVKKKIFCCSPNRECFKCTYYIEAHHHYKLMLRSQTKCSNS